MKRFGKNHWTPGILAAFAVVVVTLIPQISVWVTRGKAWEGSYAITDPDELVYSAYLNAIINGRPRRNDPFLAKESSEPTGQETYFSIQFFPPYISALVGRLLGLTASSIFILLTPLAAFASALAIFWFLSEVTGDQKLSAIGVLIILLCGVVVSANLVTAENNYGVFSFLRRYIPAIPFPLFFIFCLFLWRSITNKRRKAIWWAAAAGGIFSLLVYSYFFLWTAAAAWMSCFTLLWFVARPQDRKHVLKCMVICSSVIIIALIPYFRLLMRRAPTTDHDQALLVTHAPDLFRVTEVLGILIILALAWGVRRKILEWRDPVTLVAASLAVVPFLVFNQQIITGYSLQPFHYEQFIINYLILTAAVITDHLLFNLLLKRPVFSVALGLVVGIALALKTSTVNLEENVRIDEAVPIFVKLEEETTRVQGRSLAVFDRTILSASAPSYCSSLPLLWSPYTYTYGSVNTVEDNERLFQYFYFMGVDEPGFERLVSAPLFRAALFGLPRVNKTLTQTFQPVSPLEIQAQVRQYADYKAQFSMERAEQWPLSYVILTANQTYDLTNLDRWYERDQGELIGKSILYRVRLRSDAR